MYLKTPEQLPSHWLMILRSLDFRSQRKQSLERCTGMECEDTDQDGHHLCKRDTCKPDLSLLKTTFKNPEGYWKRVMWSDETKLELFGHRDVAYIWRKQGEPIFQKTLFLQ